MTLVEVVGILVEVVGDFSRGRGDFNRGGGRGNHANYEENMHPSWAAKRNQQKIVISSQTVSNKKIKFDDFDNSGTSAPKTESFINDEGAKKNMHPSWAAKKSSKQGR